MKRATPHRDATRAFASLLVLEGLAACAAAPLVANQPRTVAAMPLPPFEIREECVRLVQGDRLDYSFAATDSVAFEIRYRESDAVIAPIVREGSVGDSGVFVARVTRIYCLAWEAGPGGALVDYRLQLRPAAP